MIHYCDVCGKKFKLKLKSRHFKSNIHKELDKCKHLKLTIENPNINDRDEVFYANNIEHNKKSDYYLMKCDFELVFNDNQVCPYVTSEIYSIKTMCSRYKLLENVISHLKIKDIFSII